MVKLDSLSIHLKECEHNPKKPVPCSQGCGLTVPKDEMVEHNCVRELRLLVRDQGESICKVQQDMTDMRYALTEQKRELQMMKEMVRSMRMGSVAGRGLQDQIEDDEVMRWAGTLPRARVTRWGGMISTPDAVLQVTNQKQE